MTKLIAGALVALTVAGSAAVVAAPGSAEARQYYGRHHGYGYGWRGHYRPRYGYYGPRYRAYRYGYGPRYGRGFYGPRYGYRHGYRHRW